MGIGDLQKLAEDHPPYQELIDKHGDVIQKGLVTDYVDTANADPEQKEDVREIIVKDDVLSFLVGFHEAVDATTMMDTFGMSEEEVRTGLANKKFYTQAHKVAITREFGLIEHLGRKVLQSRVPAANLAVVHPLGDHLIEKGRFKPETVVDRMLLRLDTAITTLWEPSHRVDEVCAGIGFRLFDELGYRYQHRQIIKARLQAKVKNGRLRVDFLKELLAQIGIKQSEISF